MLLNLFTKKPFSPKDPASSSHEIFCTPQEKEASGKNKARNINGREKKGRGQKWFSDYKPYHTKSWCESSNKTTRLTLPEEIIYSN